MTFLLDTRSLTQAVKARAHELGFALAGVTTPEPPAHLDVLQRWLDAGSHGTMGYMARPETVEKRHDPRKLLPECRSILVLGIPYSNPGTAAQPADSRAYGRIAAYAWGEDYHDVLKDRLQALVAFIEKMVGHTVPNRWYTDSGPLMERELAQRAGLGWIGKNTMLINPSRGSYFLLAEILLGVDLEPDAPLTTDHCGTCTRCVQACPTDCIQPDRTLDATRCISYLTIELKGPIDPELRPLMGEWVFGCDICQNVCPWNERFAPERGDQALATREPWVVLEERLSASAWEFNQQFKGSPVQRTKRRGLLRNLAVAAGNNGSQANVAALARTLQDEPEPLVRGHTAWSLGQLGGKQAEAALRIVEGKEQDGWVLGEIRAALATKR
jgi:epoxyqueuosine reductase